MLIFICNCLSYRCFAPDETTECYLTERHRKRQKDWKQKREIPFFSLFRCICCSAVVSPFVLKQNFVSRMVGFYVEGTFKTFYSVLYFETFFFICSGGQIIVFIQFNQNARHRCLWMWLDKKVVKQVISLLTSASELGVLREMPATT